MFSTTKRQDVGKWTDCESRSGMAGGSKALGSKPLHAGCKVWSLR